MNYLNAACRAFSTLIPPACAGCDGAAISDGAFCSICLPAAHLIEAPFCARCKVPMDCHDASAEALIECSNCRVGDRAFNIVHALWEYDGATADAIRRIKYGSDLPALRALCRGARPWFEELLARFAPSTPLLPMPSHPKELRRRGFHVPTLALGMLGPHGKRRTLDKLEKVRSTRSQAGLSLQDRQRNVAQAFSWTPDPVDGGTALIFDDVLTTGATADSAAKALKMAGFDSVVVIVFARAPRQKN